MYKGDVPPKNYCRLLPYTHTEMCISSHAPIRNSQIKQRVTRQPSNVGSQYGPCCLSLFWRREFGAGS